MRRGKVKAAFPWIGGKGAVAADIWEWLGADIRNFVAPIYNGLSNFNFTEPFCGSLIVTLSNPMYDWDAERWLGRYSPMETVNDADCFVAGFYRAVRSDPAAVAYYADYPVSQVDLSARHAWLVENGRQWYRERVMSDPDFYDPKISGWWVWGLWQWMGGEWCKLDGKPDNRRPTLGNRGLGGLSLGGRETLLPYLEKLARRLRGVRILCGDWEKAVSPATTYNNSCARGAEAITAIFFDPPYGEAAGRDKALYAVDSLAVAGRVRDWCLATITDKNTPFAGPRYLHPRLRLVVCGYDGEHDAWFGPAGWNRFRWSAGGGFGNTRSAGASPNRHREVIWFSPGCALTGQPALF